MKWVSEKNYLSGKHLYELKPYILYSPFTARQSSDDVAQIFFDFILEKVHSLNKSNFDLDKNADTLTQLMQVLFIGPITRQKKNLLDQYFFHEKYANYPEREQSLQSFSEADFTALKKIVENIHPRKKTDFFTFLYKSKEISSDYYHLQTAAWLDKLNTLQNWSKLSIFQNMNVKSAEQIAQLPLPEPLQTNLQTFTVQEEHDFHVNFSH
jgi:hypothetical protein